MITINDVVVWSERLREQLQDELHRLDAGRTSTDGQDDTADAKRVRMWIAQIETLLDRYGASRTKDQVDAP